MGRDKYKFSGYPEDTHTANLLKEAEDNFATAKMVEEKAAKVTSVVRTVPKITEMDNGESRIYHDGTNYYLYSRVGSDLLRVQMTKV